MKRHTALMNAALFLLLLLTAGPTFTPAVGKGIADFPEASPYRALEATEEQRIAGRADITLMIEAVSWPITRVTVTIYDDQPGQGVGFITLTHSKPVTNQHVTFYYNILKKDEGDHAVVAFETLRGGGMWEDGFLNIIPVYRPTPPQDLFKAFPLPAKALWLLPPLGGNISKGASGNYFLDLILGEQLNLNGWVSFRLTAVHNFTNVQNGRQMKVWGAQVATLEEFRWANDKRGYFRWKPGMEEPVFHKEDIKL